MAPTPTSNDNNNYNYNSDSAFGNNPTTTTTTKKKTKKFNSSSSASQLADEFDDLQFLPPTRSSPPTMKNFISSISKSNNNYNSTSSGSGSGSSTNLSNLSNLSSSPTSPSPSNISNDSDISGYSDDFTLGSRINNLTVGGSNVNKAKIKDRIDNNPQNPQQSSTTTTTSHHQHQHSSRRASHPLNYYPNRSTSSKERYVFSNFRFLVKDSWLMPRSIDEPFDWLSIEMVLVPEIENILCPICLDVPFIPRFTRCGHIYCLPCLLQFFQTSEASLEGLGNNWRACPVCAEPLHLKQLRPVKFCPATEPKEGEIFHSVMIEKSVGSLQPHSPIFPNDSMSSLSPFQRLIPISRQFLLSQIYNPELNELRGEIKKKRNRGEETLEISFYEAAIKIIEDLKNAEASTVTTSSGVIKQSTSQSSPQTTYYFHQSRDGLNVFLHPLCMKILKHHFESYNLIPAELSLPIIQLERVIVNPGNRKRFKYLDHLSLGTQIILVEVDLRSIVSQSTLAQHEKELMSRQGFRDQKLISDSRDHYHQRDRSILEEWKMMEDDYYSISQVTAAMDIKVPESVKLDNLDDEASFPLPSSFNSSAISVPRANQFKKSPPVSSGSPSFSALAHSLNSPFTFNPNWTDSLSPSTPATTTNLEISPNISTSSSTGSSTTSGKKKILLFSNVQQQPKK